MLTQQKLQDLGNELQKRIVSEMGIYTQVQIAKTGVRRVKEMYVFSVIPNGNIFEAQQFEVYTDKQGNIYWDTHTNPNEDMNQKVVN